MTDHSEEQATPITESGAQNGGNNLPPEQPVPTQYIYRWDYDAQLSHDRQTAKKQARRGAVRYAWIMATAFLLCLCLLTGVLILNQMPGAAKSLSTAEVAELVTPTTVLITASGTEQFSYGTGFFVRSDGYLLTNCHVVQGATSVLVTLSSGKEMDAKIKWYSAADDLALLKIDGHGYPVPAIGNSADVKVGEKAIAIGNPAGNLGTWSVTEGIVSALKREVTVEGTTAIVDLTMLQTDAPVNPGNSGGPLCNDRGEVIGIVTRKMTDYESLGLAIPVSGAMELVNAYLETGSTDQIHSSVAKVRPTIGIQAAAIHKGEKLTDEYTASQDGILVVSVNAGSSATGILQAGDVILEFDGARVTDMETFRALLYRHSAGDYAEMKIDRMGEILTVTVQLGVAK